MKTFYSVRYNSWIIGESIGMLIAWFDDLEKARAFSRLDFTDNVIVHNCTTKSTIAAYNERVERSDYILKGVMDNDSKRI